MIEPRYGTLQTIFADRVFRIPAYQRFYSWKAKQREDLFSDLDALANGAADQHHFMATVVCHRTNEIKAIGTAEYRVYDVVDGQQRLTTLILLLKCIELGLPSGCIEREDLAKILVKRDGQLILLQANNANKSILNRFLQEGQQPSTDDLKTRSDGLLADAIKDCTRYVARFTTTQDMTGLMRLVLHRLGFVVHDTEDDRVVYSLFEVLNSRGLAVDWLDKTKSVLMGKTYDLCASPTSSSTQIEILQGIWAQIYEELAKEDTSGDEILRITATLYYGTGQGKPCPADESLDILRRECQTSTSPSDISHRLLEVARQLTKLRSSKQLSVVTEILHARLLAVAIMLAGGLNDRERQKLCDQWERVTFRIFGLHGKDSRAKVGDYVRLAHRVATNHIDARTYNEVMLGLRSLGNDYPIDGAIREGLLGKDCYERSPEMCRYVLWNFEEELARTLGNNATVDEHERSAIWRKRATDSIEHILPQNPTSERFWEMKLRDTDRAGRSPEEHVGCLGNLLLLPNPLNAEAAVLPFDEKKKVYGKHNLRMVHSVCAEQDWNFRRIREREQMILEWAKSRWCDV